MKRHMILIFFLISISSLFAQHSIELKEGLFYTNYFRSNQSNYDNYFWGWGNKTAVTYGYSFVFLKKHTFTLGIGYTNFNFLDERILLFHELNSSESRSYLHLSIAARFKTFKNFAILTQLSPYYNLHETHEFGVQKKVFVNLDLGIEYNLNNKFSLLLTCPISITPMYSGLLGLNASEPFNVRGEQIGLDFGIRYKF